MPQPLTPLGHRGLGVLLESLADERECRVSAAGLTTARMRPGRHLARAAAPLAEPLDTRAADTKPCGEGPRRAEGFVRRTEKLLATIDGLGLHGPAGAFEQKYTVSIYS